jgi:cytochrome b pre-mRNA-processing protein 3
MGLFARLFPSRGAEPDMRALWHSIVKLAREPDWYLRGGIADTFTGRFDAVSLVLALVLIRLEGDPARKVAAARLTELFIADIDGQLRQEGVGDVVMGKRMGKLMSALGGRIDAYRAALAQDGELALAEALRRNVTLTEASDPAVLAGQVRALHDRLRAADDRALLAGRLGS